MNKINNEKPVIGWFSCGVTSAVACKIASNLFENVKLYYFQIDSAHHDNDRFIKECEEWIGLKINIERSVKFKDQFDVIEKRRYINGPSGAPCTYELKKKVRMEIEKREDFEHQVFGFEFDKKEINRAVRFFQQYPHTKPIFPLIQKELTKNKCADILIKSGIQLPEMYTLGYNNNNCIGCVKGGMGYWNKIRKDFPEYFLKMSDIEVDIGATCLKKNGEKLFLKDLDPNAGRHEKQVMPDCGVFCEVEFADLISPITEEILKNPLKVGQLSLGF